MNKEVEVISSAHNAAQKGVGAQTILEVLEPMVVTRTRRLLDVLSSVEPKLEILLDVRARLSEVHRIQKELDTLRNEGADAANVLRRIAE